MIPKKIHYCWFGQKKTKLAKKCIRSWKKYCPDYEIIEWNEETYDLSSAPLYVRQAMEAKKWAFVTDYIRYKVVYEQGGIYLDTDVELIRSIDVLRENKAYFGVQYNNRIASGLGFGAEQGLPILLELMEYYEKNPFILPDGTMNTVTCPQRETEVFESHGLIFDGSEQILDGGIHIYPSEYFCPRSWSVNPKRLSENTFSIHWFAGSWQPMMIRLKIGIKRLIRRTPFVEHIIRIKRALFKEHKS
ncbi:MAG: glycosyl transferase [Clostridiales bacterium]|nr:glycosyl transferase [Clostridiales bacterium]